ncbi:MAG: class I SAM-dependent methyltransferase [Candidatus Thiodiazotropha endolucinida]
MDTTAAITLLIFPVDMDATTPFLSVGHALGVRLVGATSVENQIADPRLDELIHLPYISDPDFFQAFEVCLETHGITHVYTSHPGVWTILKELQEQQTAHPRFHLCHPAPYQAIWQDAAAGYAWADSAVADPFPQQLTAPKGRVKPALKPGEYAALHKQFLHIPGQCDLDKLTTFAHLARILPQGDLVEIGSLAGRSAFALAWLAERYELGNLISIDPWSNQAIEAQGRQAEILNRDLEAIDFKRIFRVYISNISLLTNAGYIRDSSAKAIDHYKQAAMEGTLMSPQLGTIAVTGKISLLHIDGNHDYDHVRQDIDAWTPYVMPGGWLLLDDYVWVFGDGPKKAGDELLHSNMFDLSFTMGDTLYLRKQ